MFTETSTVSQIAGGECSATGCNHYLVAQPCQIPASDSGDAGGGGTTNFAACGQAHESQYTLASLATGLRQRLIAHSRLTLARRMKRIRLPNHGPRQATVAPCEIRNPPRGEVHLIFLTAAERLDNPWRGRLGYDFADEPAEGFSWLPGHA